MNRRPNPNYKSEQQEVQSEIHSMAKKKKKSFPLPVLRLTELGKHLTHRISELVLRGG